MLTIARMLATQTVIDHFGSAPAVAEFLHISAAAVYQWGETVPRESELELKLRRPEVFGTEVPPRRKAAA